VISLNKIQIRTTF